MTLFDRLLKAAADLHAKRTAPPPATMPFTVPTREADASTCLTCGRVWDALDALARAMPPDTDGLHFLKAVTTWLIGASLTARQGSPALLVADVVDALQAQGVRVVSLQGTRLRPSPNGNGDGHAH